VSIPPGRQCVSRRMQHVMHRERQPSSLASPLNHASNAHAAEGLATLIDKDVGPLGPVSPLLPLQELVDLIALRVMDAIQCPLQPADNDGPLRQVDVSTVRARSADCEQDDEVLSAAGLRASEAAAGPTS
jgi:hypothetical protein